MASNDNSDSDVNDNKFNTNILHDMSNFVDNNIRVIRYSPYALAGIGIFVLARSTFAWKTFRTISDIPSAMIAKNVRLQGTVEKVDSEGSLFVQHIPIIRIGNRESRLPVKISCIDISDAGREWIVTNIHKKQIWFKMLAINSNNYIESVVTYKQRWHRSICVNEHLVKEGFAQVQSVGDTDSNLFTNSQYNKLLEKLLQMECVAEKKGKGLWTKPSMLEKFYDIKTKIVEKLRLRFSRNIR